MRNRVTEMFGIDVPIFAFTHKPEVAIEVTNAGGMGALAASYYQPDELERILTDMDEKTRGRPYCIDVLFANKVGEVVPMSERLKALPKEHIDFVEKILDDAGIPPLPPEVEAELLREKPPGRGHTEEGILEVLEVVVKHPQVKFVLSAMGAPPKHVVETLHGHGIKVGAMAGSAEHALKHVQAGVDLVVAQGSEAGGHTGTISSMVLWPEVVDAVRQFRCWPPAAWAAAVTSRPPSRSAPRACGAERSGSDRSKANCLRTCGRSSSPRVRRMPSSANTIPASRSGAAQQMDGRMGRSRSAAAASACGPKAPGHPALKRLELANAVDIWGYMSGQIVGRSRRADHPRDHGRHETGMPDGHGKAGQYG